MTGIILSSKYVENSLKVEFGNIIPIELPLQNKRLFEHQLEFLKKYCDEIILTIPLNYKIEVPEYVMTIELDPFYSVTEAIKNVLSRIKNSRVLIYYGDSLFLDVKFDNSINEYFVGKPIYNYEWGIANNDGLVPAGLFKIDTSLLKLLVSKVDNFDELIEEFKKQNIYPNSKLKWLDFGHSLTFYNSRRSFLETRYFNNIVSNGGFLEKSSSDFLKIWSEFNWLLKMKSFIPLNIPFVKGFDIINNRAIYSIEYLNLPILSDIFVFGKLDSDFQIKILESIKKLQFKISEIKFNNKIDEECFLVNKIKERRDEILNTYKKLDIKGIDVEEMIENNIKYFSSKKVKFAIIHGDLCFSNILFNFSNFEPILIDPRGYFNKSVGFSLFGPAEYDTYKLAHSYVLGYDYLIAGMESSDYFHIDNINKRLEIFIKIFQCEKFDLLMGLRNLFLTMIPLHSDSIKRQKSFFNILKLLNSL